MVGKIIYGKHEVMNRFLVTKEKLLLFVLSAAFALILSKNVFHAKDFFDSTAPYVLAGVLGSILFFLLFQAGLIVVKSLVFVAAELSLIIFLAQSYCEPEVVRATNADTALSALLVFGLSYVAYRFLSDAYKELTILIGKFKSIDGKWSWELVVTAIFLILFVGLFMYAVYLVVSPIVLALCIYR